MATVIDCHNKAVIGWSMATHMRTDLICDAMTMAATNVDLAPGVVFHSDYAAVRVKPRDRVLACVGGVS